MLKMIRIDTKVGHRAERLLEVHNITLQETFLHKAGLLLFYENFNSLLNLEYRLAADSLATKWLWYNSHVLFFDND